MDVLIRKMKMLTVLAHLSRRLTWAFLIDICPLSVAFVVVNFLHLLQNHWTNFKKIWHKASFRDLSLFKLFQGGIITYTLTKFKNLLFQNHSANFNKTCTNHPYVSLSLSLFLSLSLNQSINQCYSIKIAFRKCVYWMDPFFKWEM